jgi:hypothetical protein
MATSRAPAMTTPAEQAILDLLEQHEAKGPDAPDWIHTRRHHFERGMLLLALDRVRNAEAHARTFDLGDRSTWDGPLGF